MILVKIYEELVHIRKELQAIHNSVEPKMDITIDGTIISRSDNHG